MSRRTQGRRSHGEGAVYRRERDGKWVVTIELGWSGGKRRRKSAVAGSEQAALTRLAALREAHAAGRSLPARERTVGAWLEEWLSDVKAFDGTRPATLAAYRFIATRYITPVIGAIALDKLGPADVQRLLAAARRENPSASTLRHVHGVLRNALNDAERLELVPRNVARAVKSPPLNRGERRSLTTEEARRFLDVVARERLEALFVVAMTTGLRRGELLGLRWDDVDLDQGLLHVRRSLQRVDGALRIMEPKTARSRRTVPLPASAVAALRRHRSRQGEERLLAGALWRDSGIVFASTIGTLLEPRNVNRRFEVLRDRAALPWLRLHDLRHACATLLLAQGVDPRTIMELLGHSAIGVTMNTYTHVLPEVLRAASEAMDRALGD